MQNERFLLLDVVMVCDPPVKLRCLFRPLPFLPFPTLRLHLAPAYENSYFSRFETRTRERGLMCNKVLRIQSLRDFEVVNYNSFIASKILVTEKGAMSGKW